MAASEARASCQRAANCCFIQEDAKKALMVDHRLSSSSTLLSENASIIDTASRPDDPATKFMHINWNSINSNLRQPGTRWWLQLQRSFPSQNTITDEEPNASVAEVKQMKICNADPAAKFLRAPSPCGDDLERNSYSSLGPNWKVPASCTKHGPDARLQEVRIVRKQMLQSLKPNVDVGKFSCWDEEFMDVKLADGWISYRTKLIGCERIEGWRLAMERDEPHALAALKSTEKIENCDLPQPKTIHVNKTPFNYLESCDRTSIITTTLGRKIHSKLCRSTIHVLADARHLPSNETGNPLHDSKRFCSKSHTSGTAAKDSTGTESSKLAQLMEALCHSQTRAREAEKAAQQAYIEKEHIVTLFFQQAHHLFACKQWLQVLQMENNLLRLKLDATKDEQCRVSQSMQKMPSRNAKFWKKANAHKMKGRKLGELKYSVGENVVAAGVGLSLAGAGLLLGWTLA